MKKLSFFLFFLAPIFGFAQSPTVDSPTPPVRNAVDVISIFSGAYNNITGANYNPNWQQSGFASASSTFQPTGMGSSGNVVLAYPTFNYQGIEFNSVVDISAFEFLHLDIWTSGGVAPTIAVISSGVEIPHPISNVNGSWQSIDIPVQGITGDLTSTIQFKFAGGNGTSNSIYVDNLYFWKNPAAPGKDATLNALEVDGTPVSGFTPNSASYNVVLQGGTTTVPQITLATPTDSLASVSITQATTIPGSATAAVTSQDGTTNQTYTVRYFIGAPHVDAPTPPARNPIDVISVFSDAYNNITGANYNPNWQQSGFPFASSTFQPTGTGGSGDVVLAYPNFSYQGIEFNSTLDISAMEFLHVDIWTVDGVAPDITVISSGPEIPHPIPNADGTWQSIDIPVQGITGDLTGAIQFKFTGGNGSSNRIYIDNLYFWKNPAPTGKDATLSALQILGNPLPGFTPNSNTYNFPLPGGTTAAPPITLATPTDSNATTIITQASTLPSSASVLVTSQDSSTTNTYTVRFFVGSPHVDAPTPPARNPLDVISIFSDAYNNIPGANYNPAWQQSGFPLASSTFQPAGTGDVVLAYPNFNYQGIEFNSVLDITNMEFLHLDIWTVDGVAPDITIISSGTEIPHPIPNGDGAWQSIDIPVPGITADLTGAIQIKFTGGNGSSTRIYVDNLYFWKTGTTAGKDASLGRLEVDGNPVVGFSPITNAYAIELEGGTTVVPQITLAEASDSLATVAITQATIIPDNATVLVTSEDGTVTETYTVSFEFGANVDAPTPPARNTEDVISIFSDAYNNITGANYNPDWQQSGLPSANSTFEPTGPNGSGNVVLAYPNFNYQGIEFNDTLDISAMEFLHVDIWTTNGVAPSITIISSGTEIPHAIPNDDGKWQSIDIAVPGITVDLTQVSQIKFDGGDGFFSSIYVDNLYFWKGNPIGIAEHSASGFSIYPNPTNNAWNILSQQTIQLVEVLDLQGKQVKLFQPNSQLISIDASSFGVGVYFVKIISEKGIKTMKLIKE